MELPQKDMSKPSTEQGAYDKYYVKRRDGKYPDANLFVLDLDNDPFALPAIRAYINACAKEYPYLAVSLIKQMGNKNAE